MNSLEEGLREARIIVCAGTGGVGKTTIAAALGLAAARCGRRTLVLTIDPARRLADALGESQLRAEPQRVDLSALQPGGGPAETGFLDAAMLDPKPTFDNLISRLTKDPVARERILGNDFYHHLSEALAGSAEYAAMEKVHEFTESSSYDVIIVDTPPSSHALDFLSAPRRLRDFLESRFVHTLVRPAVSAGRMSFRILGRPLQRMFGLLERIAGVGFVEDLSEFLSAIDGLSEGFRDRATRVESVLFGEDTRFVLVGSPRSGQDDSSWEFISELESLSVKLAGVIVNRVRPWPFTTNTTIWKGNHTDEARKHDVETLRAAFDESGLKNAEQQAAAVTALVEEAADEHATAEKTLQTLKAGVAGGGIHCVGVPELADDLDRLHGLQAIAHAIFPEVLAETPLGNP